LFIQQQVSWFFIPLSMIKKLIKSEPLLWVILLLAFVIRLVAGHVQSFSNDELSALYRLQYTNFYDLMYWGVQVDNHPAFTQLFLYLYEPLVPKGEIFIRFPFILATTISLGYIFFSLKKLSGEFTAYLVTIILAFAGFSIQLGYFARPYAFGILFTSAATYYWIRIFMDREKNKKYLLFFILCAVLSAYTHYLALLQIAILGAASFIFAPPRLWWKILLAGLVSILLFSPHYTITKYHLSVGGIGAWLGNARDYFIIDLAFEYIDRSPLILAVFLLAIVWVVVLRPPMPALKKIAILGFVSVTPYLILYIYSVKVNPLLQYSACFFLMPYLLGMFFGFFETGTAQPKGIKAVYIGCIMVFLSSTLYTYSAFAPIHFAEFKNIARYIEEHESDSVTTVVAVNNPFFIDYYLKDKHPDLYITDMGDNLNFLKKYIDTCTSGEFIYAFTNQRSNPEIPYMIKNKFKSGKWHKYYMNSELYHFSDTYSPDHVFNESPVFEYMLNGTTRSFEKITDPLHISFTSSFNLDSATEFSPALSLPLADYSLQPYNLVVANVAFTGADRCDLQLVVSVENEKGPVFWRSRKLSQQYGVNEVVQRDSLIVQQGEGKHRLRQLVIAELLNNSAINLRNHFLKVYIWNPDHCGCLVDQLAIRCYVGNNLVTGYAQ
jgi:hypothetical protein